MTGHDFSTPAARAPRENIVPMINVVFLLLIFFLMTAQIVPPAPVEITPPPSDSDTPAEPAAAVMYLGADGQAHFESVTGDAALAALAALPAGTDLTVRADAMLEARRLAALLARLGGLRLGKVTLATDPATGAAR
ncbi:MAG: biopolymer transporter ExbD [Rhodobacteraceae bacterium]|nr:biopolymer transporter ExbD [Paracoccaceae bacterium]